jgi:hypothetical protein
MGTGSVVKEFNWSGNFQDMVPMTTTDFYKQIDDFYKQAVDLNMDSVTFLAHSAGGLYSDVGIKYFQSLAKEKQIKINILVAGSPMWKNTGVFEKIAKQSDGQFRSFWSPFDLFSWTTAFSPNSQMTLGGHKDYFNDLSVRQVVLSTAIGMDIPIGYSRFASGSFSDPYFSGTFRIQETVLSFSSGIKTTKIDSWTQYGTNRQIIMPPSIQPTFPNSFNNRLPSVQPFKPIQPVQPIQPLRPVQPIQPMPNSFGSGFGH